MLYFLDRPLAVTRGTTSITSTCRHWKWVLASRRVRVNESSSLCCLYVLSVCPVQTLSLPPSLPPRTRTHAHAHTLCLCLPVSLSLCLSVSLHLFFSLISSSVSWFYFFSRSIWVSLSWAVRLKTTSPHNTLEAVLWTCYFRALVWRSLKCKMWSSSKWYDSMGCTSASGSDVWLSSQVGLFWSQKSGVHTAAADWCSHETLR